MESRLFCLSFSRLGAFLCVTLALSGCAVTRGIVDVRPQIASAPSAGPMVSLRTIEDRRHFEKAPRDPSTPSLKDGRIEKSSLTSRAIARKRNSYGMAMGDVLLPDGRTVVDLTREALTSALHARGYRVLESSATKGAEVAALNVEIVEFWAWFTPGFLAAHLECRIHLRVTEGAAPTNAARDFKGYVRLATQAATGGAWKNTVDKAIASLVGDIEGQLASSPIVASAASKPVGDTDEVRSPQSALELKTVPTGARYDPYTGKPLRPRYDPYTGKAVNPAP